MTVLAILDLNVANLLGRGIRAPANFACPLLDRSFKSLPWNTEQILNLKYLNLKSHD